MLECILADQVAGVPLVLTSSGQEWKFLVSYKQIYPLPQMHYGIYIMGCIWQPFWILKRKGGNFLLFVNNLGSKQSVSIVESCGM